MQQGHIDIIETQNVSIKSFKLKSKHTSTKTGQKIFLKIKKKACNKTSFAKRIKCINERRNNALYSK